VIEALPNLSQKQKQRLFKKFRTQLKNGKIDSLIETLGRKANRNKNAYRKLSYFHGHEDKCRYDQFIEKNIPIAAGLGGGSSDAAATMKGMNELYDLEFSPAHLMRLGKKIGADVPFFFSNGPALATGIGEKLSLIDLSPPFWILLVTPAITVSTAWAYSQFKGHPKESTFKLSEKIDLLKTGKEILYNDLERVVIPRFPEIEKLKKILENCGAWGSLMSGSGPTVFGIFFDETEAKMAERTVNKNYPDQGWRVFVAEAFL